MGKRIERIKDAFYEFMDDYALDFVDEMNWNIYSKRARRIFNRLLTPDSLAKIKGIEEAISKIISSISSRSGWWFIEYNKSFRYEDNYQNMHDYEFRQWDTYTVKRNENGYYVDTEEPFNEYFAYIRRTEQAFYDKFKDLLAALHLLLIEQEKFYNGGYELQDESLRSITDDILIELDIIKPKKELSKEEKEAYVPALKQLRNAKSKKH